MLGGREGGIGASEEELWAGKEDGIQGGRFNRYGRKVRGREIGLSGREVGLGGTGEG
jgi:hypothetical protein